MWIGKWDGFDTFRLEYLHQSLIITTIPLNDTDDLFNAVFHDSRIDALDPGTGISWKTSRFSVLNHFIRRRVADKNIIQVYRYVPRGEDDLNGNSWRNPNDPVHREVFHNGECRKQIVIEFQSHEKIITTTSGK